MNLHISWATDVSNFLENLLSNSIAQIVLPSSEITRAFAIFEVINRGGTPLNEYDLIVAKAARNKELSSLTIRINEDLKSELRIHKDLTRPLLDKNNIPKNLNLEKMGLIDDNEPSKLFKNQFLSLLSIFSYSVYGKIITDPKEKKRTLGIKLDLTKREKKLKLTTEQINKNTPNTLKSLKRALAFLQLRCGVVKLTDLHYQLMILPIAYALKDCIFRNV